MINVIVSVFLVLVFLFFGQIIQAIQRIFKIITKLSLFLLNLIGIKITQKEKIVLLDKEFYDNNKEVNKVVMSKSNLKKQSSIDWIGLSMLIISLLLFIINLQNVSGNAISNWIYSQIAHWNLLSSIDVGTFYTATIFSVISFSITRLLNRWKETKELRRENKELRLKRKALKVMSTKELLEEARKKNKIILENKEE